MEDTKNVRKGVRIFSYSDRCLIRPSLRHEKQRSFLAILIYQEIRDYIMHSVEDQWEYRRWTTPKNMRGLGYNSTRAVLSHTLHDT